MSHTVRTQKLGSTNAVLVICMISSYVAGQGGESFTLAELGLTTGIAAIFLLPNSQVSGFTPVLNGFQVLLESNGAGEIPSNAALNYTFGALIDGN